MHSVVLLPCRKSGGISQTLIGVPQKLGHTKHDLRWDGMWNGPPCSGPETRKYLFRPALPSLHILNCAGLQEWSFGVRTGSLSRMMPVDGARSRYSRHPYVTLQEPRFVQIHFPGSEGETGSSYYGDIPLPFRRLR